MTSCACQYSDVPAGMAFSAWDRPSHQRATRDLNSHPVEHILVDVINAPDHRSLREADVMTASVFASLPANQRQAARRAEPVRVRTSIKLARRLHTAAQCRAALASPQQARTSMTLLTTTTPRASRRTAVRLLTPAESVTCPPPSSTTTGKSID